MCSTLVYVEGDATLDTYEDAEGKSKTSLNIVQREWPHQSIDCISVLTFLNTMLTNGLIYRQLGGPTQAGIRQGRCAHKLEGQWPREDILRCASSDSHRGVMTCTRCIKELMVYE